MIVTRITIKRKKVFWYSYMCLCFKKTIRTFKKIKRYKTYSKDRDNLLKGTFFFINLV
jgi:hypothetical protein